MLQNITKAFRIKKDLRKNEYLKLFFVTQLYNDAVKISLELAKRQFPLLKAKDLISHKSLWKSLGKLWKIGENLVETLGNLWGKIDLKNKNCKQRKISRKVYILVFG